jgi:hypothetical protein
MRVLSTICIIVEAEVVTNFKFTFTEEARFGIKI